MAVDSRVSPRSRWNECRSRLDVLAVRGDALVVPDDRTRHGGCARLVAGLGTGRVAEQGQAVAIWRRRWLRCLPAVVPEGREDVLQQPADLPVQFADLEQTGVLHLDQERDLVLPPGSHQDRQRDLVQVAAPPAVYSHLDVELRQAVIRRRWRGRILEGAVPQVPAVQNDLNHGSNRGPVLTSTTCELSLRGTSGCTAVGATSGCGGPGDERRGRRGCARGSGSVRDEPAMPQ